MGDAAESSRDASAPQPMELSLREGEHVVSRMTAKTGRAEGELRLTNQRLVFSPKYRLPGIGELMKAQFRPVPPDPAGSEKLQLLQALSDVMWIPFTLIKDASAGHEASLMRPPSIRITSTTGSIDFGAFASPRKANRSPENTQTRDAFLRALKATLATPDAQHRNPG